MAAFHCTGLQHNIASGGRIDCIQYRSDYEVKSLVVFYRTELWNEKQRREALTGDSATKMVYRVKAAATERVCLRIGGRGSYPGLQG